MRRGRRGPHAGRRSTRRSGSICTSSRHRRLAATEYRPDVVAVERVFSQTQRHHGHGHRAGQPASRCSPPPRPRHARRVPHAQRGQGRGHRQRPRRQGSRSPPWSPAARARRRRRSRPTPPTPWPWRSATSGAAPRSGRLRGARRRHRRRAAMTLRAGRAAPDDRQRDGRVAAVSPDGAVVEVGGVGLAVQCTPGTARRGRRSGEAARLSTTPGRARGLADALRLRRRRRARPVRAAADRDGRRPAARPGDAGRPHRRDEVRRAVADRRRHGAHAGARHRQEGRRTAVLELKDRLGRPVRHVARRADAAGRGRRRSRPWRDQVSRRSSGSAGRAKRGRRTRCASWRRSADARIAATGVRRGRRRCCGQALQLLGRGR